MNSEGLSWADQWDYNPDPPPPSAKDDGKKKDGSESCKDESLKKKLNFKWVKQLVKKSHK